MARRIIKENQSSEQGKTAQITQAQSAQRFQDMNWEEESYRYGCEQARKEATKRLEAIEERLFEHHPEDWSSSGFEERTLVTRFGEITLRRRVYMDESGHRHYLLDEYLDLPPYKSSTPSLTRVLVKFATETSFQKVSETMSGLVAGVLSDSTIHRLLQDIAQKAIDQEKKEHRDCFHEGKLPEPGDRQVSILHTEADSIWVHLQREEQERYELKNGITYEGWERLPQKDERYRLVNKKVYCHGDGSIPFWEGMSLLWDRNWDLSGVNHIVLNGDGANWIDKGKEEIPFCIRQLDGFHLSRACRRGWDGGGVIYELIRSGHLSEASQKMSELMKKEGKTSEKYRVYAERQMESGVDWRIQIQSPVSAESRGMGCIESNEDKPFANRMKKRGMSWTIKGTHRMGKAIELACNGDLEKYCGRKIFHSEAREDRLSFDLFETPVDTLIPALVGPHASRPWVKALREMVMPSYQEN